MKSLLKTSLIGITFSSLFSFIVLILQSLENRVLVYMGQEVRVVYAINFLPIVITFVLFSGGIIALLSVLFNEKET